MSHTPLISTSKPPYVSGENCFYIEFKHWAKLLGYAKAAYQEYKAEIGGMMVLTRNTNGDYLLSHPTILKQSVSAGSTTIDKEALAHYYTKAFQKHGKDVKFVWWHSHGTMKAFMSLIDESTIQEYANGDWSLSLVVNVFGDYKLRLQVYNPLNFAVETTLDMLNNPINKPASQSILDEVKEKVVSRPIITPLAGKGVNRDNVSQLLLGENAHQAKEELTANFIPRLYAFVANALADYRDEKINYDKLRRILIDVNSFSGYFDYCVDCPPLIELDGLLIREKNPAKLLIFKIGDIWE